VHVYVFYMKQQLQQSFQEAEYVFSQTDHWEVQKQVQSLNQRKQCEELGLHNPVEYLLSRTRRAMSLPKIGPQEQLCGEHGPLNHDSCVVVYVALGDLLGTFFRGSIEVAKASCSSVVCFVCSSPWPLLPHAKETSRALFGLGAT